jgi:hypothetical protein
MTVGPLLTDALRAQSKILSKAFSFAMNGYQSNTPSIVDFGNTIVSRVDGGTFVNKSVSLGFNDDFFWSSYIQAIAFNTTGMEFAFDGAPYTIFDTGTSHLMVPSRYFQPILDNIIEGTRNPLTNTTVSYKVS